MRRLAALLLACLTITADSQPAPSEKPMPSSAEEELLALHRKLVRAIETSDTGVMSRLVADDFSGSALRKHADPSTRAARRRDAPPAPPPHQRGGHGESSHC